MYQLFNFDDRLKKTRDALGTDFLKELKRSYTSTFKVYEKATKLLRHNYRLSNLLTKFI